MKICLPNGTTGTLRVDYGPINDEQRTTQICLQLDNGLKVSGLAKCHPNDRFTRIAGRKYALADLLSKGAELDYLSREYLWKVVCPSYFKTKTRRERRSEKYLKPQPQIRKEIQYVRVPTINWDYATGFFILGLAFGVVLGLSLGMALNATL